jgi:putative heme uptake system protein
MDEVTGRRTYLLIDGENLDATLGVNVLQHRPAPDERPRWEKVLTFTQQLWEQPVTALFFLNASSGHLPMSFVQALTAIGFRSVPLSGPADVKVVDVGIQRTLDAIADRDADVLVGSHDRDFAPQIERLLDSGHQVAMLGFPEAMSGVYADLGVRTYDLEYDAKAFNQRLPRIRVIPLAEFDPAEFLD